VEVVVLQVFKMVYIRRIAGLCFVSQYGTEVDWTSEFEVAVYYIMWWYASFKNHRKFKDDHDRSKHVRVMTNCV